MIMDMCDVRRRRHLLPGVTNQKAVDGHLCVSVTKSMNMNINVRGINIMCITRIESTITESESPSQGSMRPVYTPDSVSQPGGARFIHKIFVFLYSHSRKIKSCIQIIDNERH